MSISSALSNALSGLSANAKSAEVVSNNLANALTPGYAPRELALSARGDGRGGGVMVDGVTRSIDPGLLAERRLADSDLAEASVKADFLDRVERLAGTPDQPGSLSRRYTAFSSDLVTAAAKPEEDGRLRAAVSSAGDLARAINDLSRRVQASRGDAETRIARTVSDVNGLLSEVHDLNARIVSARNAGQPAASFEDQRRTVIDQLAEHVPLRLARRDNGAVAIYTPGGATLLDGRPAKLTFSPANLVTAHMTLENGLLSGLEINGKPVAHSGARSPVAGGRLAAQFEVRDRLATDVQAQLDALARDLAERFQAPGLDTSRVPGDAGLFTDEGLPFDPANETGLAGRLTLNSAVAPGAGGDYWRLRDGLGAATPGPVGNGALLNDLSDALDQATALASGDLGATPRPAAAHVSAFVAQVGHQRLTLDRQVSFTTAHQSTLVEAELGQGVDSDSEMHKLLLIEKAYSANARMIRTVDEMIDALLRI